MLLLAQTHAHEVPNEMSGVRMNVLTPNQKDLVPYGFLRRDSNELNRWLKIQGRSIQNVLAPNQKDLVPYGFLHRNQ